MSATLSRSIYYPKCALDIRNRGLVLSLSLLISHSCTHEPAPGALVGGAILFKACGAGKGQGGKKGLQQKTEKLLRSIADSCVPRSSRRATDLLWRSRVESDSRRSAQRERANRSRARGRSTASSRARRHLGRRQPEMTAARAYVLSSCRSYLPLEIPKFSACGAGLAPQAPISLPQEGHKAHRRNGRIDGLYKLQAVHCCWSGARLLVWV